MILGMNLSSLYTLQLVQDNSNLFFLPWHLTRSVMSISVMIVMWRFIMGTRFNLFRSSVTMSRNSLEVHAFPLKKRTEDSSSSQLTGRRLFSQDTDRRLFSQDTDRRLFSQDTDRRLFSTQGLNLKLESRILPLALKLSQPHHCTTIFVHKKLIVIFTNFSTLFTI